MTNSTGRATFALSSLLRRAAFASALIGAAAIFLALAAQAQTLTVLHTFTGGADGAKPVGLTMDAAGNLYGTTFSGGLLVGQCAPYNGCGVVFKVSQAGTGWTFAPIYSFTGANDGSLPLSRVIFGPSGTLYGTTALGGPDGTGVVFNLRLPARVMGSVFTPWTETVLYAFGNVNDGNYPGGDLLFDAAGNIYGTTQSGGYECEDTVYCGVVYELMPHRSSWSESILYEFSDGNVAIPLAGVVADQAGNLYGTTSNSLGAAYELIHSESGWTENTVHYFGGTGDGNSVSTGMVFDSSGNLYGTTQYGGTNNGGTVFELSSLGAGWGETVRYNFPANSTPSSLFRDSLGNLYGVASGGGAHNQGWIFELTPSGGGWTGTDLYDFSGGANGAVPTGNVVLDSRGNIYGTTVQGGGSGCFGSGCGVVWKLTP